MKMIVGLGNPGSRYSATKHNLGKIVVTRLARVEEVPLKTRSALEAVLGTLQWGSEEIVLAYPTTYMNVSGRAVAKLVRKFGIKVSEDLLIVVDDLALPLGRIRLRSRGSDGGHNGLKSVDQALASRTYARLRLGIGHPREGNAEWGQEVSDYVLTGFSRDESESLERVCRQAEEACRHWVETPIGEAMSVVNQNR